MYLEGVCLLLIVLECGWRIYPRIFIYTCYRHFRAVNVCFVWHCKQVHWKSCLHSSQTRKFTSTLKFSNEKYKDTIQKCSSQSHLPIELLFFLKAVECLSYLKIDFVFFYLVHLFYSSFVLTGLFPHAWSPFWYCWLVLPDMSFIFETVRTLCNPSEGESVTWAYWAEMLCNSVFYLVFHLLINICESLENLKRFNVVHYVVRL